MNRPASTESGPANADSTGAPCPYCDRRLTSGHLRSLHVGEAHPDRCTDAEREAYREAYDRESRDLLAYRITALGALVVLYFGLLFAYAIFAY